MKIHDQQIFICRGVRVRKVVCHCALASTLPNICIVSTSTSIPVYRFFSFSTYTLFQVTHHLSPSVIQCPLCYQDSCLSHRVAEGIPDWNGVKLTFSCLIKGGVMCVDRWPCRRASDPHTSVFVTHFKPVWAHSLCGDKVRDVRVRFVTSPHRSFTDVLVLSYSQMRVIRGWCACDSLPVSYVFPFRFSPWWSVNWTDNHNTSAFRRP